MEPDIHLYTLSSVLLAVLAEDTGGKSLVAYGAGDLRIHNAGGRASGQGGVAV